MKLSKAQKESSNRGNSYVENIDFTLSRTMGSGPTKGTMTVYMWFDAPNGERMTQHIEMTPEEVARFVAFATDKPTEAAEIATGGQSLNWWKGTNGNLFADSAKHRYSVGSARDGSAYWVARNGEDIGNGLISLDFAKHVAQADANKQAGE